MTEQEQMNDLIDQVYQWGVDRKIIGNGKLETQWLKLLSEFGEMCDTLAKGGDPIDDIGDQLVVMIMIAGICDDLDKLKRAVDLDAKSRWAAYDCVEELCNLLSRPGRKLHRTAIALENIAAIHCLSLYQCLEHSYNQIKDRKGYLNEQGVFIKE